MALETTPPPLNVARAASGGRGAAAPSSAEEGGGEARPSLSARRGEVMEALDALSIELRPRELRLMLREVDHEFLAQVNRNDAEDRARRRRDRCDSAACSSRVSSDTFSSSRPAPVSPAAAPCAGHRMRRSPGSRTVRRSTSAAVAGLVKGAASQVRLTQRVLRAMRPSMGVECYMHGKSQRGRRLRTVASATTADEQRRQTLVENAIGRVKARKRQFDARVVEMYRIAAALSGREPGSPRAMADRHATDHEERELMFNVRCRSACSCARACLAGRPVLPPPPPGRGTPAEQGACGAHGGR
jgi:hypothetical protein